MIKAPIVEDSSGNVVAGPSSWGGGPPGGGGSALEKRVENLESAVRDVREKLIRIESKVDSIEKHGSTKADLTGMESTLIKWFLATALAITGITFAIVKYVPH